MILNPLYLILKILQRLRTYQIRLSRFLLINEFRYLTNNRIRINTDYLFDSNFRIDLDNSKSEVFIGKDVVFREAGRITCFNNGKILIHDGVYFNRNCSLNSLFHIEIGDHCLLGENVKIYDHNHIFNDNRKLIKEQGYTTRAVKIGKNCWIGSNSIILQGVSIGDNVIIGANNLIIKDVPSNTVVKSNTSSASIVPNGTKDSFINRNYQRTLEPKRKKSSDENSLIN